MKTSLVILGLGLLLAPLAFSQTADQHVTAGRNYLTQKNLAAADNEFAAAVAQDVNHATGNALRAVTRLLNLVNQTPAQNFLTRLGVPAAGRDLYHWDTGFPKDTQGIPVVPTGVNAAEFTPFWRTNALPQITSAQGNLVHASYPGFLLDLSSAETTTSAVTVDYGDILMLRAGLCGMEYFSYTLMAQNLDAQLTAIRSIYTNDSFSVERLLTEHPALLTFASTNDLSAARSAFINMVDLYQAASDFMRARAPGVTRLFMFADGNTGEQKFRQTLVDLKASLNAATVLSSDGNYTFFVANHFTGVNSLRSFLPQFKGSRMVLGSLPDPTFGGVLLGHSRDEAEDFIVKNFHVRDGIVPSLRQPGLPGGQPFRFTMRAEAGRGYMVQASTNLINWVDVTPVIPFDMTVDLLDTDAAGLPRRFYRVVDRNNNLPVPRNDAFANRTVLPSGSIPMPGYNKGASEESGEDISYPRVGKSVWYEWTAPSSATYSVVVQAPDFTPWTEVYTGSSLGSLNPVATGSYGGPATFNAVAGQAYQITVDSTIPFFWDQGTEGGFKLAITQSLP